MSTFWSWFHANWPAILVAALIIIPALITGLSQYPKASGAVKWLRVVFDLLSVVQHADSPGTFKVLGKRSRPPVGQEVTSRGPKAPPATPPTAVLVLAFLAASLISACGPVGKQVAVDLSQCAAKEISAEVSSVLPDLMNAMMGTQIQYDSKIAELEARGVSFAVCAVSAAIADLSKVHGQLTPEAVVAIKRGRTYLAMHGVR
jgi:hypothetical protein